MKYAAHKRPARSAVIELLRPLWEWLRLHRRLQWQILFGYLVLQDLLLVYIAFKFSFFTRFNTSFAFFQEVVPQAEVYESIYLLLLPIFLVAFMGFGLYNRANILQGTREAGRLFNAVTICSIILVAVDFFHTGIVLARGWIVTTWAISFLLVGAGRYVARLITREMRAKGLLTTPALIIGANAESASLAEQLYLPKYSGLEIIGFIDEKLPAGTKVYKKLRTLGSAEAIDRLAELYGVEELIITSSALPQEQIVQLFEKYGISGKLNIRLSSGLYEILTTSLQVSEFANVPLVQINRVRLTGLNLLEKTISDYIMASILCLLTLPFFLVVGFLVKRSSPGPIIHRRRVMGVNGKQFDAFKFRTMRVDGDQILAAHPELAEELRVNGKLKDDPRVTRIGSILRKTSLDELPQLFNVLRNEMSIVGPRMISPAEMCNYKQHGMNLLTVKPGITGLWQVSGRSDITYEERVRLDMHYIRNWSIWFDLQLLLRTIPAVLLRRGAY